MRRSERLRTPTDKYTSRDDSDSEAKDQGRAGQGRAESMGRVNGGTGQGTGRGQARADPRGEQRRSKASAAAASAAAMKPDEAGVSLQKNKLFLVLSAVGAALFQLAFIIPQLTTPLVTYFEQQGVDRFGDTGGKGATAKQKLRLLFLSAFQLLDQARYKGASWSLTAYTAFYRFVNMTGVAAGVAARGVVTRCTQPFCRRRLAAELGSDGRRSQHTERAVRRKKRRETYPRVTRDT